MAKGFLLIILLILAPSCLAQTPSQSAIVSSNPLATKAGFNILKKGGNAFDAAVIVGAILSAEQDDWNGGSIWLLHDARQDQIQDIIIEAQNHTAGLVYVAAHYGKIPFSITDEPAIQKAKQVSSLNDAAREVVVSKPLKGEYHALKISTASLPSTGGIALLMALNILGDFELNDLSEADKKHLVIESLRATECDEHSYLFDHESAKANFPKLITEEHALQWRKKIKMNQALASSQFDCKPKEQHFNKISHFAILDQQGNCVSATLSNKVSALTKATPTLFDISQGMGLIGTSDEDKSTAVMLLGLLTAMDDYYPSTWMLTPRYYPFIDPALVEFEKDGFPEPLQKALALRGYQLKQVAPFGSLQGIFWDKKNNKVYAASDPRGNGLAIVEKI